MEQDTVKLLVDLIGSHTKQIKLLTKQQFALVDCTIQTLSALLKVEENLKNGKTTSIQTEIDELKNGLQKFIEAGKDNDND
ncbi:hypothetical protein [Brucella intermedia]|uniref:hypothetical protein n=1 Tax=Brucella intermedia TaxID=94625 RepID=UPI0022487A87|nr:hypothetical protein [Brucella intermedia]